MKRTPRASRSAAGVRPRTATGRPCESRRSTIRRPRKPEPPVTSAGPWNCRRSCGVDGSFGSAVRARRLRPSGEREPVDLRVVADVHRKAGPEIERPAMPPCGGWPQREGPEAPPPARRASSPPRATASTTSAGPASPAPDEGAAPRARMRPENLLAGLGEQHAVAGGHALGLPAEEPQPSRGVERAAVPHPVPETARRRRIGDLRRGRGLGKRVVFPGDHGAADDGESVQSPETPQLWRCDRLAQACGATPILLPGTTSRKRERPDFPPKRV